MVQWQLCTLDELKYSRFGRPFPRHGLQLLFWFANHCVTCELINFVVIMKLVSDCQPERGFYGFHVFGNIEELLPVLKRRGRCKIKTQVVYFEVGNLNTETYPASANLPMYVRENYGLDGNRVIYNIDRIVISYQVRTRMVETVYVTEHDGASFGSFSPDRTYEISSELIRALQSPQLDLTAFLSQMGYYDDIQVVQDIEEIRYREPSNCVSMFNIQETYNGSTARTENDNLRFFSEASIQQININRVPLSYDQQVHYTVNVTPYNSGLVANTSEVQHKYRRPKANKRQRALRQSYWLSEWELPYKGFNEEAKKRKGGGGVSFVKTLLCAGALCLAAKCFSWLRSWWNLDLNENILKAIPWRPPSDQHPHIMLDYVY
ncbi:uncharacterized protein LOC120800007 [Xiphias gladius]|uniref:uncharacterized protein LOC120800007 n=1 Tax=Xiphias gladius TaxID=8245 RepID=UPI001A987076|nr:uncharacterized protein LOC120800007 [Xiphias gladius]XP_040001643.1 uncharacterized protein LOC120800007 [Xiphias gladius]XP_040001644.1 uncharacterized protein LOC120800007 [Xiphias gladius]